MKTRQFKKMFACDSARIYQGLGKLFLIIGWNRPNDYWRGTDGKPCEFRYLQERVVASGETEKELLQSVKHFKRLLGKRKAEIVLAEFHERMI